MPSILLRRVRLTRRHSVCNPESRASNEGGDIAPLTLSKPEGTTTMQPLDIILLMGASASAVVFIALALFGGLIHLLLK